LLATIAALQPHFFVLSGSTLEGLSTTFYQKIAQIASQNSSKLIVDTSGEALQKVLATGAYLIKPNVGELAKLIGVERLELEEVRAAARQLLSQNNVAIVVVSLGPQGAALVTATDYVFVPAPTVVKKVRLVLVIVWLVAWFGLYLKTYRYRTLSVGVWLVDRQLR